jgi:hypothetical protein
MIQSSFAPGLVIATLHPVNHLSKTTPLAIKVRQIPESTRPTTRHHLAHFVCVTTTPWWRPLLSRSVTCISTTSITRHYEQS